MKLPEIFFSKLKYAYELIQNLDFDFMFILKMEAKIGLSLLCKMVEAIKSWYLA